MATNNSAEEARDAGLEPMTRDQCDHLKALAGRVSEPDAFDEMLTRSEAAKRIVALETRLAHERHSGKERLPRT